MRVVNQNPYLQTARPVSKAPPAVSIQAPIEGNQLSDVEKLMDELKSTYKNIHFDFISLTDQEQIQNYAASKKGLNNVALSPKLLEKMVNDEGLKNRVKNVLNLMSSYQYTSQKHAELMDKELIGMGLILDENGEVSKWSVVRDQEKKDDYTWLIKRTESSRNPLAKTATKKKRPYVVKYNYSHSQSMMQLASAKNVPSVRGVIARKQGEIAKVKAQVTDPAEAARIIRSIKILIKSGGIKIARLHKEEQIYRQERAAAKRKKLKQEQRLAEELRKKRIARKAEEHCQTTSLDDVFKKTSVDDYQYKRISDIYTDTMAGGYTGEMTELAGMGTPTATAAASASAAQITVAPVGSVDCSA